MNDETFILFKISNLSDIDLSLEKNAQMVMNTNNPRLVAIAIKDIIQVMIQRMKFESQQKSYDNIRGKLDKLNVVTMSQKKNPGGASIGVSLGIIKNVLNGRDPFFIHSVLNELKATL